MSWRQNEWKNNLPAVALQKVRHQPAEEGGGKRVCRNQKAKEAPCLLSFTRFTLSLTFFSWFSFYPVA